MRCGEVIITTMSVGCKQCVLGETYSSAYEVGACKDCKNCGPYRKTIKACTLTSEAVCGGCKIGTYIEPVLGMCFPCSSCCNDGKDIFVPECQVPGVPINMHCSILRSTKCSSAVVVTSAAMKPQPVLETRLKSPSTDGLLTLGASFLCWMILVASVLTFRRFRKIHANSSYYTPLLKVECTPVCCHVASDQSCDFEMDCCMDSSENLELLPGKSTVT